MDPLCIPKQRPLLTRVSRFANPKARSPKPVRCSGAGDQTNPGAPASGPNLISLAPPDSKRPDSQHDADFEAQTHGIPNCFLSSRVSEAQAVQVHHLQEVHRQIAADLGFWQVPLKFGGLVRWVLGTWKSYPPRTTRSQTKMTLSSLQVQVEGDTRPGACTPTFTSKSWVSQKGAHLDSRYK